MRAGSLRHRCIMQRPVRVKNPSAGFDVTWSDIGKTWADISLPTGRIAPIAEQLKAVVSAEIRIRPHAYVIAGMRLVHVANGLSVTYLIEAVLPDNARSMFRLLCSNVPNS